MRSGVSEWGTLEGNGSITGVVNKCESGGRMGSLKHQGWELCIKWSVFIYRRWKLRKFIGIYRINI
jgi:hypothetical protein